LRSFLLQLKIEQAMSLADLAVLRPKLLDASYASGTPESKEDMRCLDTLLQSGAFAHVNT
jgi:hypothetical protein